MTKLILADLRLATSAARLSRSRLSAALSRQNLHIQERDAAHEPVEADLSRLGAIAALLRAQAELVQQADALLAAHNEEARS